MSQPVRLLFSGQRKVLPKPKYKLTERLIHTHMLSCSFGKIVEKGVGLDVEIGPVDLNLILK